MSLSAQITLALTVTEQIANALASANARDAQIIFNAFNVSKTLNGSTSPAASVHAAFTKAMTAGAATIDFTSLTGTFGTVSANGLKPRAVLFQNPATNANAITIAVGASNGHPLLGAAFSVTLAPGETIVKDLVDQGTTVDSTHKTIDISGTGTQALICELVFG
jgi:hypothetical protein